MTDAELIRLVADSKDSDPIPLGDIRAVIRRLVSAGVMPEPQLATPMYQVVDDARSACRDWVDEHGPD